MMVRSVQIHAGLPILAAAGMLQAIPVPASAQDGGGVSDMEFEAAMKAGPPTGRVGLTPAAPAAKTDQPSRRMDPLAGLGAVSPQGMADALWTCIKVVNGRPIEPAAMHALGWQSVESSGPDTLPNSRYYARPSGTLTIFVGRSGDNAKVCSSIAVIGSAADKAELERIVTARLGPPGRGGSVVARAGGLNWRAGQAEIVMDIGTLTRGGIHRAWIIVHPAGLNS